MPQAKTEIALQFSERCAAESALQHSLFCSADVICSKSCAATKTKNCTATLKKLRCTKVALSWPLSCGFQAPTFRHPCLYSRGRPNHDHDHFWLQLAGPHFSFLGYPRMTHQMPLLHSGTQRNHKDFSSDVPSNAILVWHQMQNFFGKLWLWWLNPI